MVTRTLLGLLAAGILCAALAACADDDKSTIHRPEGPDDPGDDPPAEVEIDLGSYAALRATLDTMAALTDASARDAALDALWDTLRADMRLPFVTADTAAFLYRGTGNAVAVAGDFNGWDPAGGPATRIGATDVWLREEVFPLDARLDYKIVRDGSWILDPENPRTQRSGFGDNSELRMPGYEPSPWVEVQDGVPQGTLTPGSLASTALGYTVNYEVYQPADAGGGTDLATIYVTDGHEYADPLMGSMVQVLDNMIAAGEIRPVIAVFIDPRVGGVNLRAEQYVLNPLFAQFVAEELVPVIDAAYPTDPDRTARAILGTSLGGLNSAYFAIAQTDTWGLIAMQSPAFWAGDAGILDLYEASPRLDVEMFLSWGTFFDFGPSTEDFRAILDAKGYDYTHVLTSEGHSWGQWRALLDDVLRAFWAVR
jgi:enterochelin esterase family protein